MAIASQSMDLQRAIRPEGALELAQQPRTVRRIRGRINRSLEADIAQGSGVVRERRRKGIAERMATAVVKRLTVKKIVDVRDEEAARAAVRQVVDDNLTAEERIEADARQILLTNAKMIKDSGADYRALLGKVKEKLARERGFIL